MKKIHNYELQPNEEIISQNKSPFAVYERETAVRHLVDFPSGILIQDIHKEILKALSTYLVLTSELTLGLLSRKGFHYSKPEIQKALYKLKASAYVQAINFESDSGSKSAYKAYILSFRGIGYLNALGIRQRMGGYLASLDVTQFKKILSTNQLLIKGAYEHVQIGQIILVEPQNPKEKASFIFRPSAIALNKNGEIFEFFEAIRKNNNFKEFSDKLERMTRVLNEKANANIPIADSHRLVIVAEDFEHMIKIMQATENFRKKMSIVYSYDYAIYSSPSHNAEDFLYEYEPAANRRSFGFLKKLLAACF